MKRIDFKKELEQLYDAPTGEPVLVNVPALRYLMVDGEGDPNTAPAYADAVEALFALAYTLKFAVKNGPPAVDYGVMPLEGLWWADDMSTFTPEDKSGWKWTMMIMQPDPVTEEMVRAAMGEVKRKKDPPALSRVRFEVLSEGEAAQIVHRGPFSEEGPSIERLHRFIDERGRRDGRHHEIYLSDIRRTDPGRWKTVIRHPIRLDHGGAA
jgi:hypothetical protein